MQAYRILLTIDAAALGLALLFFLWGLSDGSVSAFNIVDWMLLLGGVAGVVFGGIALRGAGRLPLAIALLALLAVPATLTALLFAILIVGQPRWN